MKTKKLFTLILLMLLLSCFLIGCGENSKNLADTKTEFVEEIIKGNTLTLAQMNGLGEPAPTLTFKKADVTLVTHGATLPMKYRAKDDTTFLLTAHNEDTNKDVDCGYIKISGDSLTVKIEFEGADTLEYHFTIVE